MRRLCCRPHASRQYDLHPRPVCLSSAKQGVCPSGCTSLSCPAVRHWYAVAWTVSFQRAGIARRKGRFYSAKVPLLKYERATLTERSAGGLPATLRCRPFLLPPNVRAHHAVFPALQALNLPKGRRRASCRLFFLTDIHICLILIGCIMLIKQYGTPAKALNGFGGWWGVLT